MQMRIPVDWMRRVVMPGRVRIIVIVPPPPPPLNFRNKASGGTIPLPGTDEALRIQRTWRNICNCPYNRKSNGHRCGATSAWSRPGGAEPLCYVEELPGYTGAQKESYAPNENRASVSPAKNEAFYSSAWCKTQGGNANATIADGTRPDCLLPDRVVEFDWGAGMKPYECVGQALHYSRITGKDPVCVLIKKNANDAKFANAVRKAKSPLVELRCMDTGGAIIPCPN